MRKIIKTVSFEEINRNTAEALKEDKEKVVKEYQVWFVPTKLGAKFGWNPELICVTKDEERAKMVAYLEHCDEPAPDKDAYMSWHAEEITTRSLHKENSNDVL